MVISFILNRTVTCLFNIEFKTNGVITFIIYLIPSLICCAFFFYPPIFYFI